MRYGVELGYTMEMVARQGQSRVVALAGAAAVLVALVGCDGGAVTSPTEANVTTSDVGTPSTTEAVAPSTGRAKGVSATTAEPVDGSPTTMPLPLPSAGPEASVATVPPPPEGYPPSVLGDIDAASSRLSVRPVNQCGLTDSLRPPIDGEVVAPYPATGAECLLGPPYATGSEFENATVVADGETGLWLVDTAMTRDGLEAFNQLAALCYSAEPACPSSQIAIVFDDVVVSAPRVLIDAFENEIEFSSFDEDDATALADAINRGG